MSIITFPQVIKKTFVVALTPLTRFIRTRPRIKRRVVKVLQRFPSIDARLYRLFHEEEGPPMAKTDRTHRLGALPPRGRIYYKILKKHNSQKGKDPS